MGRTIDLNINFNSIGNLYINSVVIANIIMDDMSFRGTLGGDLTIKMEYLGALLSYVLASGDDDISIRYLSGATHSRIEDHADFTISLSPAMAADLYSIAGANDAIEVGLSYAEAHAISVKYRTVADCTFTIAEMDDMTLRDMYIIEET